MDQKTRWSSIANILIHYLYLIKVINTIINLSDTKAFKDNKLILSENEIKYLENYLKIFKIFVKATTKLQIEKYSIIYYLISEVYIIYNKLENLKEKLNISFYI